MSQKDKEWYLFLIFFSRFFSCLAFRLLGFSASWLLGFLAFRLLGFSASWLFGFVASRLLGFLASWLFGFLASRLLGFSAFGLLGFLAFRLLVGLCGFWWLFGFGFSHPLHLSLSCVLASAAFRWFMWLLVASAFCILCFLTSSPGCLVFAPVHWFLALAPRILSITSSSLFESSLLRTSWGASPPIPPLLFRLIAEI